MADMCWHMLTLPTNKAIGLEMIDGVFADSLPKSITIAFILAFEKE